MLQPPKWTNAAGNEWKRALVKSFEGFNTSQVSQDRIEKAKQCIWNGGSCDDRYCLIPFERILKDNQVRIYTNINTSTKHTISVSYRGWGALGFPTPTLSFPPQALLTLPYSLYTFPTPMTSGSPHTCSYIKNHETLTMYMNIALCFTHIVYTNTTLIQLYNVATWKT